MRQFNYNNKHGSPDQTDTRQKKFQYLKCKISFKINKKCSNLKETLCHLTQNYCLTNTKKVKKLRGKPILTVPLKILRKENRPKRR